MTCDKCAAIVESPADQPHSLRKCDACGREMRVVELGKHGRGVHIRPGDRFVIPGNIVSAMVTPSFDPRKSVGRFTRVGLQWNAERLYIEGWPTEDKEIEAALQSVQDHSESQLEASELLQQLGLNQDSDPRQVLSALDSRRDTLEWWQYLTGSFAFIAKQAMQQQNVSQAVWATALMERCRAMAIFKSELENVVWMGHSAKRIIDSLARWECNRQNCDEAYWQAELTENSYLLSQVFAAPVVFLQGQAYVGGMKVDKRDACFTDFLLAMESSGEAILIEIKTPCTRLLGRRYRSLFRPSSELAAAVVQVLDQRDELLRNQRGISEGKLDLRAINPRCVVIAGNAKSEFDDPNKRRSFELFRSGLHVEVVTFDELFGKAKVLLQLFSLRYKEPRDVVYSVDHPTP